MKITDMSVQAGNPDRVNVSVDGKYRFSLDILQVTELGVKVGKDYSEEELADLENESHFGKLYARTLEYVLMRPHSSREVRDYLYRKTRATKYKKRGSNEVLERPGVSQDITERVYNRLLGRGYIDDDKFARYWVENRQFQKGISPRKLIAELRAKGVDQTLIAAVMQDSPREEKSELEKVLAKKRHRYDDDQKLIAYLMRQGFSYDAIRQALSSQE